jgi:hypothetical protein
MRNFLNIFKIIMSVLVMIAGILEWIEFESEVTSIEMHHGMTAMGIVIFIDGADKIFQSVEKLKVHIKK